MLEGTTKEKILVPFLQTKTEHMSDTSMFWILEPSNLERWEFGLGPVVNLCKSMDNIWNSYEEKVMCLYQAIERKRCRNHHSLSSSTAKWYQLGAIASGTSKSIVTKTKCVTHTFDCTTHLNPQKPASKFIHFYPYCISHIIKIIDEREYTT